MSERDALHLAALLHDIGRVEDPPPAGDRDVAAASRAFVRAHAGTEGLPPLAAFPPAWGGEQAGRVPGAVRDAILRRADACVRPAGPAADAGTRLLSVFGRITMHRAGALHGPPGPLPLAPVPLSLTRESQFPSGAVARDPAGRTFRWRALVAEAARLDAPAGWFALLHRHLVNLPLDAAGRVSLFDAAHLRAAIALALHDEWARGAWHSASAEAIDAGAAGLPAPVLLLVGALSGIQDFLFDLPSRRASKSLRGRSAYVQMAAEACARWVVDDLALRESAVLYSGGGSFVLLVPACAAERIEAMRRTLGAALLPESLALALDAVPVGVDDLAGAGFGTRWAQAHARAQRRRHRRFQELGVGVFAPRPQRAPPVPAAAAAEGETEADTFAEWTRTVSLAAGIRWTREGPSARAGEEGGLFARLGVHPRTARAGAPAGVLRDATAFNRTDFAGAFRDFRFAVKDLPRYDAALIERLPAPDEDDEAVERMPGTIVQFVDLARLAALRTGTEKLGVLKMDVDDLGELFTRGLPESERTATALVALSRSMSWFFEGHLNEILQRGTFRWRTPAGEEREEPFAPNLYPVYAGGDDLLVLGAWDAVFAFALAVREAFRAFVGHHPAITLSASLTVVGAKESVVRFVARADERLEEAKGAHPSKDRVSVFGHVLRWEELLEAARLRERLEVLVKCGGESRALLLRVQQTADDHARLQGAARRGVFRPERIWRLAYFLGRSTKPGNRAEIERIAELHERLLLAAFTRPAEAANPALFAIGGRWAELACRHSPEAGSPFPPPEPAEP